MIRLLTKSCDGPKSAGGVLGGSVRKRSRRRTRCSARIRSQPRPWIAIQARVSLLNRNGYSRTDRFHVLYSRSLVEAPIAQPDLDAGLRLRHATDADLDARVDVHRDAWSVWGKSKVTVETYRRLRSSPIYDPELDVVLENAAGKLLSYCIGWRDAANGIGHFEPVGCRPDFAGRGYARAVTIEGLRRMQARGLHTALVGTESINRRARVLYPSCGFVEVDRAHYYVKEPG